MLQDGVKVIRGVALRFYRVLLRLCRCYGYIGCLLKVKEAFDNFATAIEGFFRCTCFYSGCVRVCLLRFIRLLDIIKDCAELLAVFCKIGIKRILCSFARVLRRSYDGHLMGKAAGLGSRVFS